MCLLVVAWRSHPQYRLVIAANRDEFRDRPAAALGEWTDAPGVYGGRDLHAGGTWLALDRRNRVGAVTNYRELARRRRSAPSRGGLVPQFLRSPAQPGEFLRGIELDATGYAGFNLLVADSESLWYASNRSDQFARELAPGIYGLSNHSLDTPWPKLVKVRARFSELMLNATLETSLLLDMLADPHPAAAADQPSTGLPPDWERALSAPFVHHENYGTRCSTVVSVSNDGVTHIVERRFDDAGRPAGDTAYDF
jgi:uncharacterized protein with NRDE domain